MTIVTLATWNAGKGNEHDLLHLLRGTDVLAGNEWGDRHDLTDEARGEGWGILGGRGLPGLSSTPLFASPRADVLGELAVPLLPRHYIGPGAGPSHNKPKGMVGGRVRVGRARFGAVSTHLVASSYLPLRRKAAQDHIAALLEEMDQRHHRPWFILGDFNTTPTSRLLRPMYRAGWTNTHREAKTLPTHGRRAIDFIWWRKDPRVRFIAHRTVETKSDHRALVARFEIKGA
jgi:hypothetical protein